jgi:thiosulfate dehydrogenase [quinone] large subunit
MNGNGTYGGVGPPMDTRLARGGLAMFRIVFGLLWLTNASWKVPPKFDGLRHFTSYAVSNPVFGPYKAIVQHVVLPNMTFFGYVTLITEASLGAFLILGLATRFWAVVGIMQSTAIALAVLNAPAEWSWAYYMLITGHVVLWATAAGRAFGLDGVLRPGWLDSRGRVYKLLGRVS